MTPVIELMLNKHLRLSAFICGLKSFRQHFIDTHIGQLIGAFIAFIT